jgi:hypothetical protein
MITQIFLKKSLSFNSASVSTAFCHVIVDKGCHRLFSKPFDSKLWPPRNFLITVVNHQASYVKELAFDQAISPFQKKFWHSQISKNDKMLPLYYDS